MDDIWPISMIVDERRASLRGNPEELGQQMSKPRNRNRNNFARDFVRNGADSINDAWQLRLILLLHCFCVYDFGGFPPPQTEVQVIL